MNNLFKRDTEILPLEDSIVSATALPLDLESSETAYETATFGMG